MKFDELEIAALLTNRTIQSQVQQLKAQWAFRDLDDGDFFALLLLAPAIGLAMANGSISLYEELALNKKARHFSKGNYFLRKDPIMEGMSKFINDFAQFEQPSYELLARVMANALARYPEVALRPAQTEFDPPDFRAVLLNGPYVVVKMLGALFLNDEDLILQPRGISRTEYDKLVIIGQYLGLGNTEIFQAFCQTYTLP